MKIVAFTFTLWPMFCVAADPLFPRAEGTTWNYEMVEERPSADFDLTDPNEEEHFAVRYRIGATKKIETKDLQPLGIYRADALEAVDLIAIEEAGISCPARMNADGSIVKLVPPQQMLALPLQSGKGWTFAGTIGETKVKQRDKMACKNDLNVPGE